MGGSTSVVNGLSSNGDVVGYSTDAAGVERAFLFDGQAITDLSSIFPEPLRASRSSADAVQGTSYLSGVVWDKQYARAWTYQPATRKLVLSESMDGNVFNPYSYAVLSGIAADGAAVGVLDYGQTPWGTILVDGVQAIPKVYYSWYFSPDMNARGDINWGHSEDAFSIRLGDGTWGSVSHARYQDNQVLLSAFNDQRQAAGNTGFGYYCPNGARAYIGNEAVVMSIADDDSVSYKSWGHGLYGVSARALDISDNGENVAGSSLPTLDACAPDYDKATLFKLNRDTQLVTPVRVAPEIPFFTQATRVNDAGQVLAFTFWRQTVKKSRTRHFVWTEKNGIVFLSKIAKQLDTAERGIFQNNAGQLAGTMAMPDGSRRAFRVDCPTGWN